MSLKKVDNFKDENSIEMFEQGVKDFRKYIESGEMDTFIMIGKLKDGDLLQNWIGVKNIYEIGGILMSYANYFLNSSGVEEK